MPFPQGKSSFPGVVDKVGEDRRAPGLPGGVSKQAKPAAGEVLQLEVQLVGRAQSGPSLLTRLTAVEHSLVCHLVKLCLHPQLRPYYDVTAALSTDPAVQLERLSRRDPDKLGAFIRRWIPLENAYFEAFSLFHNTDVLLRS